MDERSCLVICSGLPPRMTLWFAFFFLVAQHAAPLQGKTPNQAQKTQLAQKKPVTPAGNTPSGELHKVGETVAKAVLDRNIDTLLSYDRTDLRAHDTESLKNNKSDLYCYIFDSECITWGDGTWRSVYEKLSQAKSLHIKVNLVRSSSDQQLYGSLLFYDSSTISEKDLRSFEFVCKEAPARVASWRFRRESGKWKAVTPLFDSETLGACPHPPEPDEDDDKAQTPPPQIKP
jgi:hypothetical protein